MLRAVAFKNFVWFRDHQSLEFENGLNIIVGANATGKSVIFELIRRTLPNTANASTSNVTDTSCPAFVICKFEITENLTDKVSKGCYLYTHFYVKHLENGRKEMYKLVCIANTDKPQYCCLDCFEDVNGPRDEFTLSIDNTEISVVLERLIRNSISIEDVYGMIHGNKIYTQKSTSQDITECETILQTLHEAVAITFPIRSPGPIQWSHCHNIGQGNEHYDTASEKAEILQQLMGSEDIDEKLSDDIFKTIVHPLEYNFKKSQTPSSDITVNESGREEDVKFLKVPEGIIEAKQFSLLFAHKKYQTLLLEEPDRAMHPQMIQKLRDLVFRKCKDRKIVMVTSHQPVMIDRWCMSRLFVCRRKRDTDGNLKHSVFKLSSTIENIRQEEDILKQMLYSAAVLFVEGVLDKSIIRLLFDHILETKHLDGLSKDELNSLQKVIAGTQVISTDGSTQYNNLRTMAGKLEVPCVFLLDKDTMFKCMAKFAPEHMVTNWRKLTLSSTRILLQKRTELQRGSKMSEESNDQKENTLQRVLNTVTTNKVTIRQEMKLNDSHLELGEITTVVSFINHVVLPSTFQLKPSAAKVYDLPPTIKERKNDKAIVEFMRREKNVFLWDSGNLEDMLLTNILAISDKTDDRKSTPTSDPTRTDRNQDKKEKLLKTIFLCEDTVMDGKHLCNPIKEALKQMDGTTAETMTACLLKSDEIRTFLKFLLEADKSRPKL